MTKFKILAIGALSIAIFLVVYSPHYDYPFPSHIDEWHHISEAGKLETGEFHRGVSAYRIGFQLLIYALSKISNVVLVYQFLPGIWAIVSGLTLFYITYKRQGNAFAPALFAMFFFASIKSNVNLTGLWFFTPLTFSIPFIFLYMHLFTEGIYRKRKSLIIASLLIMTLLIFVHAISVLFALPILILCGILNYRFVIKEWRLFLTFLLLPAVGLVFFKMMSCASWEVLFTTLFDSLKFKFGWGVLELKNSFYEIYSFMGYALAALGIAAIAMDRERLKKDSVFIVWPAWLLIMIFYYRKSGLSFLSPYQRNMYYFAVCMPYLSSAGLTWVFLKLKGYGKILADAAPRYGKRLEYCIYGLIFSMVVFFTFKSYWYIPKNIDLYRGIDKNDYKAMLFLASLPEKTTVMAMPGVSIAIYPISGHRPVATFFFYGNRKDAELFFRSRNCSVKRTLAERYNARYVLSKYPIDCGWQLIYDQGNYIYEITE